MRRRGVLVGAWAAATALATVVAWAAVRQLTDQVSPSAALPLPADVAGEPPLRPETGGTEARGEGATQPPPTPAGRRTLTEAYDLVGGVVTVRYEDGTSTLVDATPNSGFDVDVHDGGPERVEVRFRSDGHESRLATRWRGGAAQPQREERPR